MNCKKMMIVADEIDALGVWQPDIQCKSSDSCQVVAIISFHFFVTSTNIHPMIPIQPAFAIF